MINKINKNSGGNREKTFNAIEKKYGRDIGVRSDKKLWNYLRKKGYSSLSDLLEYDRKKR